MGSPGQTEVAERERAAAEMRGRIVRATSWDQIFRTPQEADRELNTLTQLFVTEHKLVQAASIPDPSGIIAVWENQEREMAYRIQRRNSGDVSIQSHTKGVLSWDNLVTCGVGDVNHPYTLADLDWPFDTILEQIGFQEVMKLTRKDPGRIRFTMRGKVADPGWEELFLFNGEFPTRIGYRLFPLSTLQAVDILKKARPELWTKQ